MVVSFPFALPVALAVILSLTSEGAAFSTPPSFRSVKRRPQIVSLIVSSAPGKFSSSSYSYTSSKNRGRTVRSSAVFQSSIGFDSGTQLPASNDDDTSLGSSSTTHTTLFPEDDVRQDEDDGTVMTSSTEIATLTPANEEELFEPPPPETPAASLDMGLDLTVQEGSMVKKVLNGLLLAASFGFAAYTIFNIDNGMTRGWTQSEIAMRIPLDNWLNYESSLAESPMFTKTAINVIIYLLGDWLSQTVFAKKDPLDFDAVRTLRNGFIGLCFGPLVVQYYQFSDHILPVEGGMWNRLEKILMDQTLYLTIKCSIYIAAVGVLQGDDANTVKTNVQTKLPNIVVTAWKFWPLVHLVTYGVVPARHRILWVNCVDLVWNAILAGMTTKGNDAEVAEDTALVTAAEDADGILAVAGEPLQVHQSDATVVAATAPPPPTTTASSLKEDPFLLHQEIISSDASHPHSLFEETASNRTATESVSINH